MWVQFSLLFQNCFGYSKSLSIPLLTKHWLPYFCKKVHWDFNRHCTKFVDFFGEYCYFNIKSSNPWIQDLSICLGLSFFQQHFALISVQSCTSLVKFICRCFIVLDATVNSTAFLTSFLYCSLLRFRNKMDFYLLIFNLVT